MHLKGQSEVCWSFSQALRHKMNNDLCPDLREVSSRVRQLALQFVPGGTHVMDPSDDAAAPPEEVGAGAITFTATHAHLSTATRGTGNFSHATLCGTWVRPS